MASKEYVEKVHKLIEDNQFLMLSKSWCPDCHYVYKIWDKFQVNHKIHIIELDKYTDQNEAIELEKAFTEISGRKWVPTIFFNGQKFGTERELKDYESQNQLEDIFKKVGLI